MNMHQPDKINKYTLTCLHPSEVGISCCSNIFPTTIITKQQQQKQVLQYQISTHKKKENLKT